MIEAGRGPDDAVEWHPVTVNGLGQSRTYYVLHLPVIRPMLDERRSKFYYIDREKLKQRLGVAELPDTILVRRVIQYSFNADALAGCHVFGREDSSFDWFVSGTLKQAIEAAGCTGLEFDQGKSLPANPRRVGPVSNWQSHWVLNNGPPQNSGPLFCPPTPSCSPRAPPSRSCPTWGRAPRPGS